VGTTAAPLFLTFAVFGNVPRRDLLSIDRDPAEHTRKPKRGIKISTARIKSAQLERKNSTKEH
jgi:hypothetical protein